MMMYENNVICSKCGHIIDYPEPRPNAINIAFNRGWIEIDGKLYCPDCVEYDEDTDSYNPKAIPKN